MITYQWINKSPMVDTNLWHEIMIPVNSHRILEGNLIYW